MATARVEYIEVFNGGGLEERKTPVTGRPYSGGTHSLHPSRRSQIDHSGAQDESSGRFDDSSRWRMLRLRSQVYGLLLGLSVPGGQTRSPSAIRRGPSVIARHARSPAAEATLEVKNHLADDDDSLQKQVRAAVKRAIQIKQLEQNSKRATGKESGAQNEVNCMNNSRVFKDAESVRSGLPHVTSQPMSFPPHPDPGGVLSRSLGMPSRNNVQPSIWDTHGISGTVFANPTASSSAPYPQESNPWVSNVSEHTSPHVMSESQTPIQDQRRQSGPSARNSVVPGEGGFSKNYGQVKCSTSSTTTTSQRPLTYSSQSPPATASS